MIPVETALAEGQGRIFQDIVKGIENLDAPAFEHVRAEVCAERKIVGPAMGFRSENPEQVGPFKANFPEKYAKHGSGKAN